MNLLQQFYSFLVCLQIARCYDSRFYNTDLPIYEPFPLSVINPTTSLCKNGSTDVMSLFNSNQQNFLALNLQLCGFAIYNITDKQNSIQIVQFFPYQPQKGQVLSLSNTDSQNYLWVGYTTGLFEIYDISKLNFPLVLSQNLTSSSGNDILNKVIQFPQYNLTFLACQNNFKLITWQQNQLTIQKEVELSDWNIVKIRFAFKQTFLVVQGFTSIHFYQQPVSSIQQGNLNYYCSFNPSSAYVLSSFEVIQETILVIQVQLYKYIMVDISDFIQSYNGKTCDKTKIKYLDTYPSDPLGNFFALSKDQKFLYTQQSSIGVLVFDVSKQKLETFQIIKTEGTCGDVQLSDDENYLFYSNWFDTKIFKKTQPNLNLDIPNLLLNSYQLVSYTFYKTGSGSFDNQIIYEEPSDILYMTRKDQGSAIFKYQGEGVLDLISLVDNGIPNISISYQARVPGTNIFYQSREILGLQIVDYTDIANPKVLKTNISLGFKTFKFEQIIFNKAGTLGFVANIIGVVIISIQDILNPQVLSQVNTSNYLGGDLSLYKFSISHDEKTLLLFPEFYGIVFADITDPLNPYFLFKIYLGNIYFLQQTQDSQYLVCGVGYQGVFIYQINQDRSLTLLSQVRIKGVIYFQWLIYNDNYLIVTTAEIDSIILVSLVDKKNPEIIQIIPLAHNDPIYWLLPSQDQSFLFASAQKALYQYFIQSQIIIHSQVYKLVSIPNSNQFLRQLLQKGQPFQVGDIIQIYLVNIYQTKDVRIQEAFYYQNFVIQGLPSWIQYSPSDQVLSIQASKEALIADTNGQYLSKTLQQIIFLSYQGLGDDAFTNVNLNISSDDSINIKQICMRAGYLDKSGFVSSTYSPQNEFSLADNQYSQVVLQKWNQTQVQLQSVLDFIQFTLNQNIINYVIQFYIEPSLVVDLKNSTNIISSNQNQVIVTLQVTNGLFVNKLYPGILVLINSEQNIIQLQGSVSSVNSVLANTIKLSLTDKSLFNSTITDVTIDDQINYKFVQTLPLSQATFISLQSPVTVQSSLQDDLNQQYPNAQLAVQTPFNYKMSESVFKCVDSSSLQYKAKVSKGDGNFEEIPAGYWLSFSSNERTLIGTPQTNLFNQQFTIQIEATDGYTTAKDQVIITVSIIPFFLVLQIIIQILGPVLGILGVWKYRTIFYNIMFKRFLIYSKEIVHVSEYYEKKIIITDNMLDISLQLWKPVENQLLLKFVQLEMSQAYQSNKIHHIITNKYGGDFIEKSENNMTFVEQLQKSVNYNYDYEQEDQINQEIDTKNQQKKNNQQQDKTLNFSTHYQQNQKNNNPNQSKYEVNNSLQSKKIQTQQSMHTSALVKQINVNERMRVSSTIKQSQNQQLFLLNGEINFDFIKKQVLQNHDRITQKERMVNQTLLKQLNTEESRLSTMLKCLAAEYFIECSPLCTNLVNLLKQKALHIYKEIDWYRAYVKVQVKEKVLETNFPTYLLEENSVRLALYEISEDMQKEQIQQSNSTQKQSENKFFKEVIIYLPLIEQYLFAEALGVTNKKRKFFEVSKGDCFHCYSFQIRSIKCYEKSVMFNCCVGLQEFFGLNQVEKGLSENQMLPEWMQIDSQKTEITLKGTPDKKHVGESRFKFYDLDGYLIRQFDLQVLPKRRQFDQEEEEYQIQQIEIQVERKKEQSSINDDTTRRNLLLDQTSEDTTRKNAILDQTRDETTRKNVNLNKSNSSEKIQQNLQSLSNSHNMQIISDKVLELEEQIPQIKNSGKFKSTDRNLSDHNIPENLTQNQ
ncbi:hypothetical protein TTHERM_01285890 (macronuclear) [Tetrahymena thermophila SB210]|uniref:Dystroglycan-type cadherin-like domain-containing protein n=1 Tax=Tetrahymena thermophila (strain SB210) TaxID=312017 RepID=Q22A46_TETTS|nr:hypothetical protein TTHERM_01285890 [Tetrahymena thermophila SB210]EAR82165.2 hypothetical protein TTHERM_01285890 [Tetrahymena thermophila SB210]|eukprot:XP_001029828.2 hypothetical protein TTHERM_01285890 [Tetrahymena thermophila SB210]